MIEHELSQPKTPRDRRNSLGVITAIMLGVSGVPPVFSIVVGIIFIVVAVFVLESQR